MLQHKIASSIQSDWFQNLKPTFFKCLFRHHAYRSQLASSTILISFIVCSRFGACFVVGGHSGCLLIIFHCSSFLFSLWPHRLAQIGEKSNKSTRPIETNQPPTNNDRSTRPFDDEYRQVQSSYDCIDSIRSYIGLSV